MIVECWNEHGEPRAVELDENNRAYGWVYCKHPDGQWVTLRKATADELATALVYGPTLDPAIDAPSQSDAGVNPK